MSNPYQSPEAELASVNTDRPFQYVGFWTRVLITLLDSCWVIAIIGPILYFIYGADYLSNMDMQASGLSIGIQYLIPAAMTLLFWLVRSATPGKMLLKAVIVDANTMGKPSKGQLITRYLGYFVSTIPFGLGLIWVGIDDKKQGWHDKMAGTVVVRFTGKEE